MWLTKLHLALPHIHLYFKKNKNKHIHSVLEFLRVFILNVLNVIKIIEENQKN